MLRLALLSVCTALLMCSSLSPSSYANTVLSKSDFEQLLLKQANADSIATDMAGAWENIHQHLLLAKFVDASLYKRALLQFARDLDECKTPLATETSYLACAASNAADAASSLTLHAAEAEFRKDAETFATAGMAEDPERLADVLLQLARSSDLWMADQALTKIDELFRAVPKLKTTPRRYQTAVTRARLFDARLDQKNALEAFSEVVTIARQERARAKTAEERVLVGRELVQLVGRHLRGQFCDGCGNPVAAPAKQWLHTVLTQADRKSYPTNEQAEHEYLLLAFSAPPATFTAADLKSYAKRFLQLYAGQGPMSATLLRKLTATQDDTKAAIVMSLASFIGPMDPDKTVPSLLEKDERQQARLLRQVFKGTITDNFEQFGADKDIAEFLDSSARYLEATGYRNAARVALEVLAERKPILNSPDLPSERVTLANVYAPALARLASTRLAQGDTKAATRLLNEASQLAATKLRHEWIAAGENTILALRDFTPALRLIAQKRNEIAVRKGLSRNGPDHDALFQAMQAAVFGETALALEVARLRRIVSDDNTRQAQRDYLEASAQAERAKQIAAYNFQAGDINGALAGWVRQTAAQRDTAKRIFESRLPGNVTSLADIESVSLAEARTRLGDGEALVLLQVGSKGLYGFLLDKTGQSLAWRSDVGSRELENLVSSLRAAGDVTRTAFPPLPLADAARLHSLILGPVGPALATYRKLIIVGDGPLQAMPYGLLLTRPFDQRIPDGPALRAAVPPWLIRSHAIALLPSVRTLVAQRTDREASRIGKPFLGIGNPQLASAGGKLRSIDIAGAFGRSTGGLADVSILRRLVSLPETADELRTIATMLAAPPDALLLGTHANERTVRAMDMSDYRIVAFATHGALAGEVNGTSEPGLVLTPPAEASREDDGFLSLSEIIGLRFNADLVMLSACNTATSDGRPRAEGLSGLARGFFSAGARSLLATHWAIPSDSSVKLTTGLFAHRAAKPEADWSEAVRASTLALIDGAGPSEWAHPAYWAGFAAIGVLPNTP